MKIVLSRYSRKAQPKQYSNSICLHSAKTRYGSTFNNSWYAWLHYVGYVVLLPLHMTGVTMIDDTLKEIRFVFNVGLLHSPYVIIYIKKRTTTSIQSSNTHIHTERERKNKRDGKNIYVKVRKAVKEEGVIYANMYCNMKSYKCILTTSPLSYKFWYFRKKVTLFQKEKRGLT